MKANPIHRDQNRMGSNRSAKHNHVSKAKNYPKYVEEGSFILRFPMHKEI